MVRPNGYTFGVHENLFMCKLVKLGKISETIMVLAMTRAP
jgi:hypothetical protein